MGHDISTSSYYSSIFHYCPIKRRPFNYYLPPLPQANLLWLQFRLLYSQALLWGGIKTNAGLRIKWSFCNSPNGHHFDLAIFYDGHSAIQMCSEIEKRNWGDGYVIVILVGWLAGPIAFWVGNLAILRPSLWFGGPVFFLPSDSLEFCFILW